ncbi:hypothetical protein V8C42DRAFT_328325 [Trichoderma barbatum]
MSHGYAMEMSWVRACRQLERRLGIGNFFLSFFLWSWDFSGKGKGSSSWVLFAGRICTCTSKFVVLRVIISACLIAVP